MKDHFWRMFFAIPLQSEYKEEVRQNILRLKVQLPELVVDPQGWHISLFFVPAIERSKVKLIIDKLKSKTWHEQFDLVLDHLGASPDAINAKTLWFGVGEGQSTLQELIQELSSELQEFGLPTNPKFSNGHLVLSRLPQPKNVKDIVNLKISPIRLEVKRFVFFRSEPELGAQYYEEIASLLLPPRW